MTKNKARIFISPLDWGIGHATRITPVIREFIQQGSEVIIGADGRPYDFLKREFPGLELVRFPGIKIRYPEGKNMAAKMLFSAPCILGGIAREHKMIDQIVDRYRIDIVVSDNRFGLWTKKAKSVYLTHQMMIKTSWRSALPEKILKGLHYRFIKKYDQCWIPDLPGEGNLSGDLSHKYPLPVNASYIGPLSRFTYNASPGSISKKKYGLLGIVSGPEPQRTIFENKLYEAFSSSAGPSAILRGIPGEDHAEVKGNVELYSHLDDIRFRKIVDESELIVARPGYSTLMDLMVLGRNAIVVPTPGQTEQEYLAEYHKTNKNFLPVNQDDINLDQIVSISENFSPLPRLFDINLLQNKIKSLII